MSEFLAPAETYKINTLASAFGRFAIEDVNDTTVEQAKELVDISLDDLRDKETPPVPHTEPELLIQAIAFDQKLVRQLHEGPAKELLDNTQLQESLRLLEGHESYCARILEASGKTELLADPDAIARAYGLPDMWTKAKEDIASELAVWGKETTHPPIPSPLTERVSLDETRELIDLVWSEVLKVEDTLTAKIYMTGAKDMYHLFWAPTSEKLDYATPVAYDRATQLSFDIPHNVAHLAHLTALGPQQGAVRYNDNMSQRAYFESVAVLSEYAMVDALSKDGRIGENIANLMNIDPSVMSADDLTNWIVQDRQFEFKLRAARLYADMLMIEGVGFDDAVSEISSKLGIPREQAMAETNKYLPWTGLGAVYTHGYRKLLSEGIDNVPAATYINNTPVRTWDEHQALRQKD